MSDLLNVMAAMSKVPNQTISPETGAVVQHRGTIIQKEVVEKKKDDQFDIAYKKDLENILGRNEEVINEEADTDEFPEFDAYLNMMNIAQPKKAKEPITENQIKQPNHTAPQPEVAFDDTNLISGYADKINDKLY